MKISFIIYADIGFLIDKIETCHNNPESSWTTKINKHIASVYSLFTHCAFAVIKGKHNYYRGKDPIKTFLKVSKSMQQK